MKLKTVKCIVKIAIDVLPIVVMELVMKQEDGEGKQMPCK